MYRRLWGRLESFRRDLLPLPQDFLFSYLPNVTNSTTPTQISCADADKTSGTFLADTLATDLATLNKALASGDANGAKIALTKIEADLNAHGAQSSSALANLDRWMRTPRTDIYGQAKWPAGYFARDFSQK
jgi:hypothetical protein